MDTKQRHVVRAGRGLMAGLFVLLIVGVDVWKQPPQAREAGLSYRVDPWWPKPLPASKDAEGQTHHWITGDVGANCVDSKDRIVIVTRGFQKGGVLGTEGTQSIASPPVLEFDAVGNLIQQWGDRTLTSDGAAKSLPHSIHGCFVDYEGNVWIGGSADGVAQKWSRDGKKMLLQIGQKGECDGLDPPPDPPSGKRWFARPNTFYPKCAEPGGNQSKTRLNGTADIYVDPTPDPVTGERGSVYLADGYGNHRIVVFDGKGNYLRQWGSAGTGPNQFSLHGGGHPHCVNASKDGLVYACDRENARIHVTDRVGNFKQTIKIDPPDHKSATWRVTDVDFSPDAAQMYLYVVDLGSGKVRILNRKSGQEVGNFGQPGPMAGEFRYAHTIAVDSKGSVYVAETGSGRRIQKFVRN